MYWGTVIYIPSQSWRGMGRLHEELEAISTDMEGQVQTICVWDGSWECVLCHSPHTFAKEALSVIPHFHSFRKSWLVSQLKSQPPSLWSFWSFLLELTTLSSLDLYSALLMVHSLWSSLYKSKSLPLVQGKIWFIHELTLTECLTTCLALCRAYF